MTEDTFRIAPLRERTHTLIVRVPPKISDAVYDLATRNGVLPRDVVCFAIERLLKDNEAVKETAEQMQDEIERRSGSPPNRVASAVQRARIA